MTLNDLERGNSPYFAFFSRNSTDFQADYITVVEDRPIMFVKFVSQFQSPTFGENYITHPAARLSAIAEHLVLVVALKTKAANAVSPSKLNNYKAAGNADAV